METPTIWIMVTVTWILIFASYFISNLDFNLLIFLALCILASAAVVDWLVYDSAKKKAVKPVPRHRSKRLGI
ncbi:hypothetical protein CW712_03950 [Candidatus Bathyarchaeota archaeon]|nr:MAG: hypothetical protein CW712_03950 [Candidatus Bathyarchaeota archaeon]